MIIGYSELMNMMGTLEQLGFGEVPAFGEEAANYIVHYSGVKSVMWDSTDTRIDDEYGNPTDEEADIMFICEHGVDAWLDKMNDIILGEDEE